MSDRLRVLVLAGTLEARQLCGELAELDGIDATASLAGAVSSPSDYPVPVVSGGFGGVEGLASALKHRRIDLLVDATHPFAATISINAVSAAMLAGVRIARLRRPPWQAGIQDDWHEHPTLSSAVRAIPSGSRVFAPLGTGATQGKAAFALSERQDVEFVLRSLEPPVSAPPNNIVAHVVALPNSDPNSEADLMRRHGCTHLLCRNSGGRGGIAKLRAAAILRMPVHLVSPPSPEPLSPEGRIFGDASRLAEWIRTEAAGDALRGPTARNGIHPRRGQDA